jgi:uncharacterized protein YjbI with pentapeptide repeats
MSNCDLASVACSKINFSGCTFGLRDDIGGGAGQGGGGGVEGVSLTENHVNTRFNKLVEHCDMRGCSFNGMKLVGQWVKVHGGARCLARVPRHTSHVTRHTSHVTRHTSHVTRHTSHVTHQVNLHSMRCHSTSFKSTSFSNCNMEHAEFDNCSFGAVSLAVSSLVRSQWRQCKLSGALGHVLY